MKKVEGFVGYDGDGMGVKDVDVSNGCDIQDGEDEPINIEEGLMGTDIILMVI